jgi:hypothetical protein
MSAPGTHAEPARRDPINDAAWVVLALALCPLAALVSTRDGAIPIERARALVDFERTLGLFFELDLYSWLQRHDTLLAAVGAFYVGAHVPALIGVLVATWCVRPWRFGVLRDWLLATQLFVVAGYLLVPTAPPRLVPGLGFGDTLTQLWGGGGASLAHTVQSPYAALPSGHVAFAVIVAAGLWVLSERRALRVAALAYPVIVTFVVVATANHLWIDAVAGSLTAAAGLGAAWALRRALSERRLPRPLAALTPFR